MRIGITCHPSAGGSGILATELGIALAERGHTVHFVTYEQPFRLQGFHDRIVCHSVDTVTYPLFRNPPYSLALATKICEIALEHGIELWHAHYAIPHAVCAILARDMLPAERRFKLVTTLHGTDITLVGSDPSFYRITRFAMESIDAVTAVSEWLSEETRREFHLNVPVRTIYNFLNLEKFSASRTERCKLAEKEEKIIMHISNFRPVKRVTDVIRVFKKISDRVPARLVMVGDGPERMSAAGVAKQLGIADKVKYLGNYENIEALIPCADIIIQPSEHESFGLVPLEAMACEVPVIGTDSGGVREVVENGVTGYLCEVGDTEAMANRAIELLTNPALACEMGRRGRERAVKCFGQGTIVGQYESLYAELVGAPLEAAHT
ncbi:MAG: N-acetyl-alpha-D-glucosaminyl L-malate synthase BshA [Candidatus Hydrogenedentes bacterium]|nr:N-acetyl-alpha-D-glucosaminyl L-malate synthase BshA [Candidatus Hydrogenedentota bacterium]